MKTVNPTEIFRIHENCRNSGNSLIPRSRWVSRPVQTARNLICSLPFVSRSRQAAQTVLSATTWHIPQVRGHEHVIENQYSNAGYHNSDTTKSQFHDKNGNNCYQQIEKILIKLYIKKHSKRLKKTNRFERKPALVAQ
jgi:hypothetical protein